MSVFNLAQKRSFPPLCTCYSTQDQISILCSFIVSAMELGQGQKLEPDQEDGQEQGHDDKVIKQEDNPWLVDSLEDFLFYNCPECPNKSQSKTIFIDHALAVHPKAQVALQSLDMKVEVDIEPDFNIEVKLERDDNYDEDSDDDDDDDDDEEEEYYPGEYVAVEETSSKKSYSKILCKKEDVNMQCYYCGDIMFQRYIKEHHLDKHGGYCNRMFGKPRAKQCKKCFGTFETENDLELHNCYDNYIPRKKDGETYKCDKCDKEYNEITPYRYHLQRAHTEIQKFQCTQCDHSTKTMTLLTSHVQRVHEKLRPHLCPECGVSFFTASQLRNHVKCVHQLKREKKSNSEPAVLVEYKCDKCEASFTLKLGLTKHLESFHGIEPRRDHICEECGRSFSQVAGLRLHIRTNHPSDEDLKNVECKCLVCNANFKTSLDLNEHQTVQHDIPETKSCDRCEIRWTSIEAVKKHIAETHKLIVYHCELCDKVFTKKANKKLHMTQVHQCAATFPCGQCSKVFKRRHKLVLHERSIHGNGGDFKCDFCSFRSCTKSRLGIHVQGSHIKETRYECELCKFFTYRKGGLGTHVKNVHDKKRNHKCEYCEMTFFARRDKIKHMVSHA
jgi:hypothetical protein